MKFEEFINESLLKKKPIKRKNDDIVEAAKKGNSGIVRKLIKEGVDVNTQDSNGMTALIYAISDSYLIIVKDLIEAGANVNLVNNYNNTPLMYAQTKTIVELLLKHGADPNIRGPVRTGGMGALKNCLYDKYYFEIFELLIKNGMELEEVSKENAREEWINLYEYLMDIESSTNRLKIIDWIEKNRPNLKEEYELKKDIKKYNL